MEEAGACIGPCIWSYCEAGIWGWLEDNTSPSRLLVPLWWPRQAQNQFWITLWVGVCPRGGLDITWTPVGPNSNQIGSAHQLCLNYHCYVVWRLNQPRRLECLSVIPGKVWLNADCEAKSHYGIPTTLRKRAATKTNKQYQSICTIPLDSKYYFKNEY